MTLWRGVARRGTRPAPYQPVTAATVAAQDSPSGELLAGWLAARLRCPVSLARSRNRSGIISVRLERSSGTVDLVRPHDGNTATLTQPGQPVRTIALAHRSDAECLADELRRLDADEVYEEALTVGLKKVSISKLSASQAIRAGRAPSVAESERTPGGCAGRPEPVAAVPWWRPCPCPRRRMTPHRSRRRPHRRLSEAKERQG